jgi:cytosine/uracil/thiamine/allantoin permease
MPSHRDKPCSVIWKPLYLMGTRTTQRTAEYFLSTGASSTLCTLSVTDHLSSIQWTNRDLASSPPADRKWTQWTFLAFWTAHAAGAGSWVAGSSLVSVGLEPLSAYLCLATSHIFITILIVLNGRGPSRYHVGVSHRFFYTLMVK